MRTIVVIPARGGSKGIPRKNLRPFGGSPLIAWTIRAARAASKVDAVVVSTDSEEIAEVARRAGASIMMRPAALAEDSVTLDPVVFDAVARYEDDHGEFGCVVTVQPTSPLLRPTSINAVVQHLEGSPQYDAVLTVADDTHLAWELDGDRPVPAYAARVNRQSLPRRLRETGGVVATRRAAVTATSRLGKSVGLYEISGTEAIDIDSADDWLYAEAALGRRRLAFITIGTRERGLGHVTRVMTLLESFTGHITKVFCRPQDRLAVEHLSAAFFPYEVVDDRDLAAAVKRFAPDVVIHDELDTDPAVVEAERTLGYKVVSFEDAGPGADRADLVFNALYPERESDPSRGRFHGAGVYVLRDEFRHTEPSRDRADVGNVLITFGGTDPSGLTVKTVRALAGEVTGKLTVVAGKGLADVGGLAELCRDLGARGARVELHRDVSLMSSVMAQADIAFSSAGRTVYELVHMRVPTVVMAQNDLELRHVFAGPEHGCLNLGMGSQVADEALVAAYRCLALSHPLRTAMRKQMARVDLRRGRDFVVRRILELSDRTENPSR